MKTVQYLMAIFLVAGIIVPTQALRYTSEDILAEAKVSFEMFEPMAAPSVPLAGGVSSASDEGYFPGDTLVVYVEIVPKIQEIKGLRVHELVDEGLKVSIVNISNHGAEYAEIVECNCDNPEVHND